jgi:hypothetical protein
VALAIAVPPMLVAQILDLALDDDLPTLLTVALSLPLFAAPVVGGFLLGRAAPRLPRLQGALLGLVTIGAIAALGALRLRLADDDPPALIIPVLALWGALLGGIGAAVGGAQRARTRP